MDSSGRAKGFLDGPIVIVVVFMVVIAGLAAVEGLLYSSSVAGHVWLVGVFALLGLFLGTIHATDSHGHFAVQDRPILRTVVASVVGALLAAMFDSSMPAKFLWVAVFGLLGWLGMRWAKYVDF